MRLLLQWQNTVVLIVLYLQPLLLLLLLHRSETTTIFNSWYLVCSGWWWLMIFWNTYIRKKKKIWQACDRLLQNDNKYHTSLCSIVSDQKLCYQNSWILIILKIILLPMTKFKIWFLAPAVLGNAGVHLYFESISTISLTMQLYHKIIVEHA